MSSKDARTRLRAKRKARRKIERWHVGRVLIRAWQMSLIKAILKKRRDSEWV